MVHWTSDYEKPFTLVIQRKRIKGQGELDLDTADTGEQIVSQGYLTVSLQRIKMTGVIAELSIGITSE